jgi:hypothetical protein
MKYYRLSASLMGPKSLTFEELPSFVQMTFKRFKGKIIFVDASWNTDHYIYEVYEKTTDEIAKPLLKGSNPKFAHWACAYTIMTQQ